ncbi:MAG: hypothetical protein ACRDO8_05945 [Nocardioidaceae bacterium]
MTERPSPEGMFVHRSGRDQVAHQMGVRRARASRRTPTYLTGGQAAALQWLLAVVATAYNQEPLGEVVRRLHDELDRPTRP